MRKPLAALLAGCGLAGSALVSQPVAAAASVPLYNVEIVIFRNLTAVVAPEQWSAEAGVAPTPEASDSDTPEGAAAGAPTAPKPATPAPNAPTSTVLPAAAAPPTAPPVAVAAPGTATTRTDEHNPLVRMLPSTSFQLTGLESRLRASGRYAPVAHVAWSQTASPWGRPSTISLTDLGVGVSGLSGTIALERGTFLHLDLRFDYLMRDPPPGLDAAPGTQFALHQIHRVRFYLRDFFDHPAFGVLTLVTPAQGSRRAGR